MKKNDNKGFLLTELLVTATIVSTVLIFLYVQFYNIKKGYEKSFNYNGVNELYSLGNIRKFLTDTGQIDVLVDMVHGPEKLFNPVPYTDIINDHLYGTNETYFNSLITTAKISKLYFMDEDITSVKNYIDHITGTEAASNVANLKKFLGYIDYDKNGSNYRLVAEFNDGSFSTLLVSSSSEINIPALVELPETNGNFSECSVEVGTVYNFDYTGGEETFVPTCTGLYKVEVWGAQGGTSLCNASTCSVTPGYGGYSSGSINLTTGEKLYINVGGQGGSGTLTDCAEGGYNGGGKGTNDGGSCGNANDDEASGGGGGATNVAFKTGLLSELENDKDKVIIVAGGGGGSSWTYAAGSGGGYIGGITSTTNQTAATQTTGYAFGQGQDASGIADSDGVAGAGGGWYGGFSNNTSGQSSGTGGSGYIGNTNLTDKYMTCYNCTTDDNVQTKTISTTCHSSTPTEDCSKEGNGYARITYIGTLPEGYTQLEYIESTGTQYIDTGYIPKINTKLELDLSFNGDFKNSFTYGGNIAFLGVIDNNGKSAFTINYGGEATSYNRIHPWFNKQYLVDGTNVEPMYITDAIRTNRNTLTIENGKVTYGTVSRTITPKSSDNVNTMYLFGHNVVSHGNNADNPVHGAFTAYNMKVYEMKIYENNNLVGYYVPVRNSSNQIGLYDIVNGQFYGNSGTGKFLEPGQYILPEGYTQLEYIESTGTQWIDTGVVPKSTTKVEFDVQYSANESANYHNGWGSSGDQEAFLWGYGKSGKFYASVSSDWTSSHLENYALDLNRHKYELQSGSQKFDGVEFGTTTIGDTASSGQTMYLFAGHVEWSNQPDYYTKEKVFSCKIYDGNTLIRDFVPVRNSSNQIGLYDVVSGQFYGNGGSGTFTAGPTVE